MNNDPTISSRRKRLLFRCQHRGMKEIDLMLGSFVQRHLASLSDDDIAVIENLLNESDSDLMAWFLGYTPAPDAHRSAILDQLIAENTAP